MFDMKHMYGAFHDISYNGVPIDKRSPNFFFLFFHFFNHPFFIHEYIPMMNLNYICKKPVAISVQIYLYICIVIRNGYSEKILPRGFSVEGKPPSKFLAYVCRYQLQDGAPVKRIQFCEIDLYPVLLSPTRRLLIRIPFPFLPFAIDLAFIYYIIQPAQLCLPSLKK